MRMVSCRYAILMLITSINTISLCDSYKKPEHFNIPFKELVRMSFPRTYKRAKHDQFMNMIAHLYDRWIVRRFDYSEQPRIPKKIHQIWLGGPLPQRYHAWRDTWLQKNPGWEYKLWTLEDIQKLGLINQDKFDAAPVLAVKSDIARYEILYREGGLYVDTDMECLGSFDVLHHCCDAYLGNLHKGLNNCIMAARPSHPLFRQIIEKLRACDATKTDFYEVLQETGPVFLQRCFIDLGDNCTDRCVIFPQSYFMPLPVHERHPLATSSSESVKRWLRPESLAIHYWHGTWRQSGGFRRR